MMRRMIQLSVFAIFLLNYFTLAAQEWKLLWSDEFDGPKINNEAWTFEKGCSIRNNEKEYYTDRPENARIENGNMVIETHWEKMGDCPYTSASMNTRNKLFWQYGRFEMRAKLPSGPGIWPAFWTCGNVGAWPENGEIDIMEMWGGANVTGNSNKVSNPGFEDGGISTWKGIGGVPSIIVKSNAHSGDYSGHIKCDGSRKTGLDQVITGLSPNTVYRLVAWVKTTSKSITLGVDGLNGQPKRISSTSSSEFVPVTCNFWTGGKDSTARIFVYMETPGDGYIDDVIVLPRIGDNTASQHLHYIGPGIQENPGPGSDWILPKGKLGDSFRIYAIEWFADHIDFFIDDTKVYTFNIDDAAKRSAYQRPHFVWVNTAVEKNFGPGGYPKQYLIDYIRIYQLDKK